MTAASAKNLRLLMENVATQSFMVSLDSSLPELSCNGRTCQRPQIQALHERAATCRCRAPCPTPSRGIRDHGPNLPPRPGALRQYPSSDGDPRRTTLPRIRLELSYRNRRHANASLPPESQLNRQHPFPLRE